MSFVHINQVLDDLRSGEKCSLVFIRATGTRRGTKKKVANAIEGWNYSAFKERTPIEHLMAKNAAIVSKNALMGIIPVIDVDNDQQLTILISHIIQYNGLIVKH